MTFKINSAKHLFKEHFEDGEHLVNACLAFGKCVAFHMPKREYFTRTERLR